MLTGRSVRRRHNVDSKAYKSSFLYWVSPAMVEALVSLQRAGVISVEEVRKYLQI